jgi:hypothetical protein
MDAQNIKMLVAQGLIITNHAYEKMLKENITQRDIKEVLLSGKDSSVDFSKRNNKTFAWNNSPHNTLTHNGLTVVFCDSKEHKCLIISVYHGYPHDYLSNQYNRRTFR